jgi:hypothetical protein
MKSRFVFVVATLWGASCNSQVQLPASKIYDSKVESYVATIRKADPEFFGNKVIWIPFQDKSLLGTEGGGFRYCYNFETKTLETINQSFADQRKMILKLDFTGALAHNFFFDNNIIAWLSKGIEKDQLFLRTFDYGRKSLSEKKFIVPVELLGHESQYPIMLDTNKILIERYLIYDNENIDTVSLTNRSFLPAPGDKIFMRKNGFVSDKYFQQQNPNNRSNSPIDLNLIVNEELVTEKLGAIANDLSKYRVECGFEDIWFFSHKSFPDQFLLIDVKTKKKLFFSLDKSIFNLDNLSVVEPTPSSETSPGINVKFSYLASMNEKNIYIFLIKDGIKLYRVENYRQMLK